MDTPPAPAATASYSVQPLGDPRVHTSRSPHLSQVRIHFLLKWKEPTNKWSLLDSYPISSTLHVRKLSPAEGKSLAQGCRSSTANSQAFTLHPRPHPTPASSLRILKGKHRLRSALPQLRPGGTSHENDISRGLRRAWWLTLECLWDAYWKGYDPKVGAVLVG